MFERVKILDTTHLGDALIGSKAANEHSDEAEEIASPEEFSPDDRESFEIVEDPSSRSSCSSSTTFLDLNEQNGRFGHMTERSEFTFKRVHEDLTETCTRGSVKELCVL